MSIWRTETQVTCCMKKSVNCQGLLDWPKRLTIAVGATKGLSFLHHDCLPAIVHRDVKSNNIYSHGRRIESTSVDFGLTRILQYDVADEYVAL